MLCSTSHSILYSSNGKAPHSQLYPPPLPHPLNRRRRHRLADIDDIGRPTSSTSAKGMWKPQKEVVEENDLKIWIKGGWTKYGNSRKSWARWSSWTWMLSMKIQKRTRQIDGVRLEKVGIKDDFWRKFADKRIFSAKFVAIFSHRKHRKRRKYKIHDNSWWIYGNSCNQQKHQLSPIDHEWASIIFSVFSVISGWEKKREYNKKT